MTSSDERGTAALTISSATSGVGVAGAAVADTPAQSATPPVSRGGRAFDPTRPLWRAFLAFLGPMVLGNVLQSLSGTFNNIFVGQMLGTRALAAVSAMFPIVFFVISLIIGIGA